nr:RDD family protein [Flavobacterium sp. ASV13]
MDKKIIAFSLFVSVLSLLIGILPLTGIGDIVFSILRVFTSYIFPSLGGHFKINEMEHSLTIALLFNSLLFASAILFFKSNEKEERLLRFIFSIIFINKCFFALDEVCRIYVIYRDFGTFYFWVFFSLLLSICLLYFLYKSIKYMNELKIVEYENLKLTESEKGSSFKSSKWQRLLHFIIDNVIFVVFTFNFLDGTRMIYFNGSFGIIENILGRQNTIWIMLIIFRFVFYFVFETLFSATPGKFLTESRVVDNQGLKPENNFVFKRTLSRYIPFDSISFLFNVNWHDSISHTQVYKEKQTGLNGKIFFLLIPIYLILWLGFHLLGIQEEKKQNFGYSFESFVNERNQVLDGKKVINTNAVLRLDERF